MPSCSPRVRIQNYPNNAKVAADAHAILGRVLLKTNEDAKAKDQFEAAVASGSNL